MRAEEIRASANEQIVLDKVVIEGVSLREHIENYNTSSEFKDDIKGRHGLYPHLLVGGSGKFSLNQERFLQSKKVLGEVFKNYKENGRTEIYENLKKAENKLNALSRMPKEEIPDAVIGELIDGIDDHFTIGNNRFPYENMSKAVTFNNPRVLTFGGYRELLRKRFLTYKAITNIQALSTDSQWIRFLLIAYHHTSGDFNYHTGFTGATGSQDIKQAFERTTLIAHSYAFPTTEEYRIAELEGIPLNYVTMHRYALDNKLNEHAKYGSVKDGVYGLLNCRSENIDLTNAFTAFTNNGVFGFNGQIMQLILKFLIFTKYNVNDNNRSLVPTVMYIPKIYEMILKNISSGMTANSGAGDTVGLNGIMSTGKDTLYELILEKLRNINPDFEIRWIDADINDMFIVSKLEGFEFDEGTFYSSGEREFVNSVAITPFQNSSMGLIKRLTGFIVSHPSKVMRLILPIVGDLTGKYISTPPAYTSIADVKVDGTQNPSKSIVTSPGSDSSALPGVTSTDNPESSDGQDPIIPPVVLRESKVKGNIESVPYNNLSNNSKAVETLNKTVKKIKVDTSNEVDTAEKENN
jgi:hypothetical protein